jgi:hypothetical protein
MNKKENEDWARQQEENLREEFFDSFLLLSEFFDYSFLFILANHFYLFGFGSVWTIHHESSM